MEIRKIRLTRKQRQFRFAIIIIVFMVVMTKNFISLPGSLGLQKKTNTNFLDNYEKVIVVVKSGDRAWNIQNELTPEEDIRKILHYVEKINEKSVGNIKPGEELTFLKAKNN